jgi:type II secretory pathway predicted ATPase ExeA
MYNEYFGFSEPPFNITPNSRFYFRTQSCDEILNIVQYGIAAGKGVLVLTGEPGTGKTLISKFLESGSGPAMKTLVIHNPASDFDALLQVLLDQLGLSDRGNERTARLTSLTDYLTDQLRQGIKVSLVIDEAQDLDARTLDDLRFLANLEFEGNALLPMVLIGQPELDVKLDQPSAARIKQRIALTRTTHPLIRMEVGPYIQARLQVAGYERSDLFEAAAIDAIATYSGGIPRLVNSLCDNALLRAYSAREKVITPELVTQAARDLRVTAAMSPDNQFNRVQWELIAVTPVTEQGAVKTPAPVLEKAEQHATAPAALETQHPCADELPDPEGVSWGQFEKDPGSNPTEVLTGDGRATRTAPELPDAAGGLPPFAGPRPISRALTFRKRWYGVAAAIALALPLLNFGTFSQLTRLYSSAPSIQKRRIARDISSDAHSAGEQPHESGIVEALFVAPPNYLKTAPRRIEIFAFRPSQTLVEDLSSTEQGSTGKKAGPIASSDAQLSPGAEAPHQKTEEIRAENRSRSQQSVKTVKVVAGSLLRKRPSAGAEIITTLEPRSRITLVGRSGDFYEVRTLDKNPIRGYVHREDAFFDRK